MSTAPENQTIESQTNEHDDDLTDEERAALDEGEEDGEGEGDGEAEDAAGKDGEGDGSKATDADEAAKKAAAEDAGAEGDGPSGAAVEHDVPLRAREAKDADDQLKALDTESESLETKFDEGDITAAEYRKGLREIEGKRSEIEWAKRKSELATEMTEQARVNAWNREVRSFMETTGATIAKSRAAMLAFDEFVKEVTADPKNVGLSDRQQLDKAHKLFLEDMGAVGFKPGDSKQPTKEAGKEDPAPKAKEKVEKKIVPTLAKVPAADIQATDDGKYAALDRLASTDPEAYEAEIAKLDARGELDTYARSN